MTNKFNVDDLVKPKEDLSSFGFPLGEAVPVVGIYGIQNTIRVRNAAGLEDTFFAERFELAESKSTNFERIAKLEEEVAELKLIVAQIRKPSTVVEEALANDIVEFEGKQYKKVDREAREGDVVVIKSQSTLTNAFKTGKPYKVLNQARIESDNPVHGRNLYNVYGSSTGRSPETVAVYELIVEDKLPPTITVAGETREITHEEIAELISEPKTANQLRAEIIEKSKKFIEVNSKGVHIGDAFKASISFSGPMSTDVLEFVVNEEKRIVVALIKGKTSRKLYARGIAKCDPSDVFNEHIGKAIALGRALGLDVSEFEQAVQPTLTVGQNVFFSNEHSSNVQYEIVSINENQSLNLTITKDYEDNELIGSDAYFLNTRDDVKPVIINDTNAQYGGVE